jgi:hypothetical protein
MHLGVTRELWTKFEEILNSLSTSIEIHKDSAPFRSLIFLLKFCFKFKEASMAKFVPDIKPYRLIILFKFLEHWKLVFGANLIHYRLGSQMNF